MLDEKEIRSRYEACGQAHVFQHIDDLSSSSDREDLLCQLRDIKVERLSDLLRAALATDCQTGTTQTTEGRIRPFSGYVARSKDEKIVNESSVVGMEAIRKGQVAALVLAGGQGTRLGFDGPKGLYDIGLPSHKSLFQLICERIQKISKLSAAHEGSGSEGHSAMVPFYIMTSPLNHNETVAFFEANEFFGLGKNNVVFFQQGMLPCLTPEGKIIMESKSRVAMAPDGNGGIYPSLQASGALDDMVARGIQYIHVFSIDNALTKPADPMFIGCCIRQGADCGNKSVWKSHAHEKVGVVAMRNGRPCIVEYSEITQEMAERTNEEGTLEFGAGNICNHFFSVDFIRNKVLPNMADLYHVARKKIPYYDESSKETLTPSTPNGIKLETFIFDVFPLSERMAVLEVQRSEEFAPVKNAPGSSSDSPDTARAMISGLSKHWMVTAGAKIIEKDDSGDVEATCEISPLTSYAGEGLERFRGKEVVCPFSI